VSLREARARMPPRQPAGTPALLHFGGQSGSCVYHAVSAFPLRAVECRRMADVPMQRMAAMPPPMTAPPASNEPRRMRSRLTVNRAPAEAAIAAS